MALFQLKREQLIKADISDVWEFISSPRNLVDITPSRMDFRISNEPIADKMYAGMIICYTLKPVPGIKVKWVTEITHVEDKKYFVDEQVSGPYSFWHHQHIFEETADGVLMKDIVSYRPPLGFLGNIANSIFIKKQLDEIFDYRNKVIGAKFGK